MKPVMPLLQASCRCIVVCLGAVYFAASVFAGDFAIVPGNSIGKTYLGESRAQVLRTLGRPNDTEPKDREETSISGLRTDTWYGKDFMSELTVSYRAGFVVQVTTDSPRFKTADGISVSSSIHQIRHRFKHLRQYTYPDGAAPRMHTRFYDSVAGIAFVNTNGAPVSDYVTIYRRGGHDMD